MFIIVTILISSFVLVYVHVAKFSFMIPGMNVCIIVNMCIMLCSRLALEDQRKYLHMCNEKLFSMKIYMAAFIFYILSVFFHCPFIFIVAMNCVFNSKGVASPTLHWCVSLMISLSLSLSLSLCCFPFWGSFFHLPHNQGKTFNWCLTVSSFTL